MRYTILNVSSSLLYVWLTTRCLRVYQMMENVALMKISFMIVLYLRDANTPKTQSLAACVASRRWGAAQRDEREEQVQVPTHENNGVQLLCAQRHACGSGA